MSYQTGTALDLDDLLQKLSTFAQANGWTENQFDAGSGNGADVDLFLSKGTNFIVFHARLTGGNNVYHGVSQAIDHPDMYMYGATGYDGGSAFNLQPGTSLRATTNWLLPSMTAYHFFTDPAKVYLHVVVETTANEFRHFANGQVAKVGNYDGGDYVMGTQWSQTTADIDVPSDSQHFPAWMHQGNGSTTQNRFRYNIDGNQWRHYYFNTVFQSIAGSQGSSSIAVWNQAILNHSYSRSASPNAFNQAIILWRMYGGWNYRSSTFLVPTGCIEDVRFVNIRNVAPSTTYNLGGDDWIIFPLCEKKDPNLRDNLPNSGDYGFAYKVVP